MKFDFDLPSVSEEKIFEIVDAGAWIYNKLSGEFMSAQVSEKQERMSKLLRLVHVI